MSDLLKMHVVKYIITLNISMRQKEMKVKNQSLKALISWSNLYMMLVWSKSVMKHSRHLKKVYKSQALTSQIIQKFLK
jgi:hypothetical protein